MVATTCSVLATVALSSCAGTQDTAAGDAAQSFLTAVEQEDGERACELMAPAARSELESSSGDACAQAVLEEDLSGASAPAEVAVFDTMAQVRLEEETVFLSRFDGEWLVVGAACTPRPGRPYDCTIQVG